MTTTITLNVVDGAEQQYGDTSVGDWMLYQGFVYIKTTAGPIVVSSGNLGTILNTAVVEVFNTVTIEAVK